MGRLIETVISIYSMGLIAYSLLSWVRSVQTDKARVWLGQFYEPVLVKIRATIKPVKMGVSLLDLSPILLIIGLVILKGLLLNLLPRGW